MIQQQTVGQRKANQRLIIDLVNKGCTAKEIAEKTGKPYGTVTRYLRNNKIEFNRQKAKKGVDSNYWGQRQNELFLQVKNDGSGYDELRPAIIRLIEIIAKRYYPTYLSAVNLKDLVQEVEAHVFLNAFSTFDPSLGFKSYSYVSAIVKYYLHDLFVNTNENRRKIKFEDVNNHLELPIDESNEDEIRQERSDELKRELKEKVKSVLANSTKAPNRKNVCKCLLNILKQKNINRYYSSYILMTQTNFSVNYLYYELNKMGLSGFIIQNLGLDKLQLMVDDYQQENGIKKMTDEHLIATFEEVAVNKFKRKRVKNKLKEEMKIENE